MPGLKNPWTKFPYISIGQFPFLFFFHERESVNYHQCSWLTFLYQFILFYVTWLPSHLV